jgi:hypothetical protein
MAAAMQTRCRWPPDKLVRIGVEPDMGQADAVEPVAGDGERVAAVGLPVDGERFGHLVADGLHRVERRHRLLEDHRDVAPRVAHQSASGWPRSSCRRADVPGGGRAVGQEPISASAVMDLPEPLSPTRPKTSPCAMSSETSAQDGGAVDGDGEAVDGDHGRTPDFRMKIRMCDYSYE